MNEQSGSIRLTRKQIEFLLNFTGETDPNVAMKLFATAMNSEGVSPDKIPEYLDKLMEKTGPK